MEYRYVFKFEDFNVVVYSKAEPKAVLTQIEDAHDNGYGWSFEDEVYFSAHAMQHICVAMQPVD